jgi:hypothetical protein
MREMALRVVAQHRLEAASQHVLEIRSDPRLGCAPRQLALLEPSPAREAQRVLCLQPAGRLTGGFTTDRPECTSMLASSTWNGVVHHRGPPPL